MAQLLTLNIEAQAKLHIAHVTSTATLEVLRRFSGSSDFTAETCPHYLRHTADDVARVLSTGPALGAGGRPDATPDGPFEAETFEQFKNEAEALFFERRLERNGGNVKRTAEELGMQRSHLYKKLDRYGLK